MQIVVFFVALAAAIAVAVLYPRLRIPAGLMIALLLGLLVYAFVSLRGETDQRSSRIPVDELVLSDVQLVQETRFTRLSGRAQNLSERYTLLDFDVRVMLYDCPAEGAPHEDCAVIAEAQGIARVGLPPRQVRHFETVFRFSDVAEVEGTLDWGYEVTGIRAGD